MGPVVRIVVALFLTSVFQMAPARATGERGMFATASHPGGMIQFSQSGRTDEDRWQEEEERRVKKRRSERRASSSRHLSSSVRPHWRTSGRCSWRTNTAPPA